MLYFLFTFISWLVQSLYFFYVILTNYTLVPYMTAVHFSTYGTQRSYVVNRYWASHYLLFFFDLFFSLLCWARMMKSGSMPLGYHKSLVSPLLIEKNMVGLSSNIPQEPGSFNFFRSDVNTSLIFSGSRKNLRSLMTVLVKDSYQFRG